MSNAMILEGMEIRYIPIEEIAPSPYQPRRIFDKQQLEELASSIKEYGIMQPVSVRHIGSGYELVAGERRLRASQIAGIKTIPAIVVNITDKESAVLAMIENIQRQNLNYIEEAEGLKCLLTDYSLTQEEMAKKLSKSQSTIANKLRLLRLPRRVINVLMENELTERHARSLLKLEKEGMAEFEIEEMQLEILKVVIRDGLTVKKTEDMIEAHLARLDEKPRKKPKIRHYIKDLRLFTNSIKQAVELMNSSGVQTVYDMEENTDGCFISILVTYS